MKVLTLTLLTCARKACKTLPLSYPLQPVSCVLERVETPLNLAFLANMLPRIEWAALRALAEELGLLGAAASAAVLEEGEAGRLQRRGMLVEEPDEAETLDSAPAGAEEDKVEEQPIVEESRPSAWATQLHTLLLETCVREGRLRCRACGHEYAVKEGIANFLLPAHLV